MIKADLNSNYLALEPALYCILNAVPNAVNYVLQQESIQVAKKSTFTK